MICHLWPDKECKLTNCPQYSKITVPFKELGMKVNCSDVSGPIQNVYNNQRIAEANERIATALEVLANTITQLTGVCDIAVRIAVSVVPGAGLIVKKVREKTNAKLLDISKGIKSNSVSEGQGETDNARRSA